MSSRYGEAFSLSERRSRFATAFSRPLNGIFRYRWLLLELTLRDLKTRYRGSYAGFLWTLLNPVLFMGLYALVFGSFLRVGTASYPAYLLSGLIPWAWFAGSLTQGTTSILDGRMYVGKTVFPANALVSVPVLTNGVNFVLSLPVLFAVDAVFGVKLGLPLLLLPFIMLLQYMITYGISLLLATYTVFFRDLQHLSGLCITALFYVMPIFYTADRIPEAYSRYVMANPLAVFFQTYQDLFYYNRLPSWSSLLYVTLFAGLILFLGSTAFRRHQDTFCEYL